MRDIIDGILDDLEQDSLTLSSIAFILIALAIAFACIAGLLALILFILI